LQIYISKLMQQWCLSKSFKVLQIASEDSSVAWTTNNPYSSWYISWWCVAYARRPTCISRWSWPLLNMLCIKKTYANGIRQQTRYGSELRLLKNLTKLCHLRYVTVTCYLTMSPNYVTVTCHKAVYYALSCVLEFMFDNNDC
jgi:hypothetical protein